MTRDHIVAAMAQAIDATRTRDRRLSYSQADAALDAALPLIRAILTVHGCACGFDVLAGRDPRQEAARAAMRGMGAAE